MVEVVLRTGVANALDERQAWAPGCHEPLTPISPVAEP